MNVITHFFKRFFYAISGFFYALFNDLSYRTQIILGLITIAVLNYLFFPLSQNELLFLTLGWALMLITELQNSSFEMALDKLHPETDISVGRSKDMAAGAVLIASCFFGLVVVAILYNHFFETWLFGTIY